jgi:hypothetical protein
MDHQVIQYLLTMGIAVIGWFLRKKDEQQEKAIADIKAAQEQSVALLWAKHDQDAKDLSDLRLHIASQHYVKTELDSRFDKMELAFKQGFHDLGNKLDKMTEALLKEH